MTQSRAGGLPATASARQRYRYTLLAATVAGGLAPAYVIRWHVGPLPTTLLELALLLTILIFVDETLSTGLPPPLWARVVAGGTLTSAHLDSSTAAALP